VNLVLGLRSTIEGAAPARPAEVRALADLGVDLPRRLARAKATGARGEVTSFDVDGPVEALTAVHVVGLAGASADDARRAGAVAARRSRSASRVVLGFTAALPADRVRDAVEGFLLASYTFSRRSTPAKAAPTELVVCTSTSQRSAASKALARAVATAEAVHEARDLANTPSNEKSPQWLAERAVSIAQEHGLDARTRSADELADEGFGGVLAVGGGSATPPYVVELSYAPPRVRGNVPHVVLVGKGITFDSGGLSLKPADFMTAMKTDMSGAAAVIGVMGALRALGVGARVTALLALAENMPSGAAFRPGDIVVHFGGRTSEISNTDAEGRLVLADLLAYADTHLDPDVVVDIATLTGAASVGLGKIHGAMYANDPALQRALLRASEQSGEPLWPLPLVEEYRSSLDSDIADLRHIGDPKVGGGSITAALFLREFVGARRWAHLDIAGPGRSDTDRHEISRGGTGFGTRVLLRWLESLSTTR
jgi:leucyl aminopeptidase